MTLDAIARQARIGAKPFGLLAVAFFAALGGCATEPTRPSLVSPTQPLVTPYQAAVDAAPEPRGTSLKPVQFKVYNGRGLIALAEDIKAGRRKDVVIIALTPRGYKNLSTNLAELERYIREQKTVIAYLRKNGGSHPRPGRS